MLQIFHKKLQNHCLTGLRYIYTKYIKNLHQMFKTEDNLARDRQISSLSLILGITLVKDVSPMFSSFLRAYYCKTFFQ